MRKFVTTFIFLFILCTSNIQAGSNFVVYSPPKCGTHLIGKALSLLLDKQINYQLCGLGSTEHAVTLAQKVSENNGFVVAHNWSGDMLNELIKRGYKVIFILRDPRDQVISMQDWMRGGNWRWIRAAKMQDPDEQLDELITGSRYGWRCYDGCTGGRLAVLQNLSSDKYFITRFENLVGKQKRNSASEIQIQELLQLAQFLDFEVSYDKVNSVAEQLFGGTRTFRHGKIGRWKKRFKPLHVDLFKTLYGNTLVELGYESDTNW